MSSRTARWFASRMPGIACPHSHATPEPSRRRKMRTSRTKAALTKATISTLLATTMLGTGFLFTTSAASAADSPYQGAVSECLAGSTGGAALRNCLMKVAPRRTPRSSSSPRTTSASRPAVSSADDAPAEESAPVAEVRPRQRRRFRFRFRCVGPAARVRGQRRLRPQRRQRLLRRLPVRPEHLAVDRVRGLPPPGVAGGAGRSRPRAAVPAGMAAVAGLLPQARPAVGRSDRSLIRR